MKVIWVSHGAGLGGAELSLLEAASGLVEAGVSVHAVLPERGELAESLEEETIPVHVLDYPWWAYTGFVPTTKYRVQRLWENLVAARKLAELCRKLQADVVVTNTLTVPVGAFAAKLAHLPHVWYMHELSGSAGHHLSFDLGPQISHFLIDRLSDKLIVNSMTVQQQFRQWIPAEKIRLVYYGVEVQPPRRMIRRDDAFHLIQVGRLAAGKRQEDAIRAVAILAKEGLNVRLTLLGNESPEYGRFLRSLARELTIEQRVDFVGFSDSPSDYVSVADVALMCSRGEAFGRVTVEAMKLGKPVIGAHSAGTAELVQNGKTGLLYRLADPEDLARKIESLYDDPVRLLEMGQAARRWAHSTFNLEKYVSELAEVFQEATAAHARHNRGRAVRAVSAMTGKSTPCNLL